MPQKKKANIVLVDDEPDGLRARQQELETYARVTIFHPNELRLRDLLSAHLVLVDYQIDLWPEREQVEQIALQPRSGLALAAVLRAHLEDNKRYSPAAFAIYSAHLARLSGAPREWSIAGANNLEWAFPKNQKTGNIPVAEQMISLANAVLRLPRAWPDEDAKKTWDLLKRLLALPSGAQWGKRAIESIEECHPPVYRLSNTSHGLAFLRWFLQKILPYPCFLSDINYLSARLRVQASLLEDALGENKKLAGLLRPFSYGGILSDFLGQRWWRSGIEAFLWDLTNGNSTDSSRILTRLRDLTGLGLEPSKIDQPVVCIDEEYRPLKKAYDITQAVRIQPEDWPPFADQAWTTIDLANETPSLKAIVVAQDKSRLNETIA